MSSRRMEVNTPCRTFEFHEFPSVVRGTEGRSWEFADIGVDVRDFRVVPGRDMMALIESPFPYVQFSFRSLCPSFSFIYSVINDVTERKLIKLLCNVSTFARCLRILNIQRCNIRVAYCHINLTASHRKPGGALPSRSTVIYWVYYFIPGNLMKRCQSWKTWSFGIG